MTFSQLLIILIGGIMISTIVVLILLLYFQGRKDNYFPKNPGLFIRLKRRISFRKSYEFRKSYAFTNEISGRYEGTTEHANYTEPFVPGTDASSGAGFQGRNMRPLAELYRKIGKKQKAAGLGFIIASVVFLVLSLPLKSVVLEVDSIVSFAVAAILLLKESRNRVQSRVLNAVVSSLGTTIAKLSSRAGSSYLYAPLGEAVSDVVVMGTPVSETNGEAGGVFQFVPPGMGLAKLFAREAEGVSITRESLNHLLPSVIKDNFGLAEAAEVMSQDGRVEVLLRKPAILCNCQNDESKSNGVVGCTVSSFLAVLYSFGSQRTLILDRCVTDPDEGTWTISMTLQVKMA